MFEYFNQFLLICFFFGTSLTGDSLACGDWTAYKDEKCFKVFDIVVSDTEAVGVCKGNGSVLAFINTREEQEFIEKYLNFSQIANNVWIGIKKTDKSFKGLDGTVLKYTNWAKGRPVMGSTQLNCVELSVDESDYGKWVDVKCQSKHGVLCQKVQTWSVGKLQTLLLDRTRELKTELDHLKANPVPMGFTYVQLSGQSEPKTLWPNTEWQNISPKFSGVFFRAEGGKSSAFGQTQEQQTQSLQFYSDYSTGGQVGKWREWVKVSERDSNLYTGGESGNPIGIKIKHNLEEIRPRNQAIRIWQRIK